MQQIFCKTLLQGDQWLNDVVISTTPAGIITCIEPGTVRGVDVIINGIVLPGMPNVHSHAFQRLIAGDTGPRGKKHDSFWSWREAMFRCASQLSPQQINIVASWVFIEMLRAGFTSCAEFHYIHHPPDGNSYANPAEMSEQLIAAAVISGMAMTLLPVLYCHANFDQAGVQGTQTRFANSPQQYLRLVELCQTTISNESLIHLGLAAHSLRAVSESELNEILRCWPDQQCPVHIHIAEQRAEVQACIAHHGVRPVEWLLDRFSVDQRWCLVHATHMTGEEQKNAAASEAVVGLCATTEADLGDGVFDTAMWLKKKGQFAIGSDSNVRISVTEELRLLEFHARLASGERNVLTSAHQTCGRFLYQHAANTGGVAVGQPVGRLQCGYRADMVELDVGHEMLAGREPDVALDSWIFAGDNNMINSVWVAGRRMIDKGHHSHEVKSRTAFAGLVSRLQF